VLLLLLLLMAMMLKKTALLLRSTEMHAVDSPWLWLQSTHLKNLKFRAINCGWPLIEGRQELRADMEIDKERGMKWGEKPKIAGVVLQLLHQQQQLLLQQLLMMMIMMILMTKSSASSSWQQCP
jgi:hypothetical protein